MKSTLNNFTIPFKILMDSEDTKSKGKFDIKSYQTGSGHFLGNLTLIFEVIAISVVITLSPITVMAHEEIDTAGIKSLVTTYQIVWNTHNPTGVAKFFLEDADMVFGNFPAARGREAIESWWQDYFNRQEPERHGWFDIISLRFMTPVTALVNLVSTTGIPEDTSTFRKARGTWLVYQNHGKWMISAMRGMPTTADHVELVKSKETAELLRPQIRAFVAAYEDTFNTHNPETLSKFYRADADIIIREQPIIHGLPAIKEWWQTYFSQPRPYRALLIVDEIRLLSEDVALINITATGASLEVTQHLVPARQAQATWVLFREHGRWLITALRVLPGKYDRIIRQ